MSFLCASAMSICFFVKEAPADKIYLEAPPLLWEEQAPKQEVDQNQYYREKYGVQPKAQPQTQPAPTQNEAATPSTQTKEPEMNQATGITQGFGVGMTENLGTPGVSPGNNGEENSGNSGSVIAPEAEERAQAFANGDPECDYEKIVGSKISDLDFSIFEGRPVRVVYPNQQITMDMNPNRVNLKVTSLGIISKISCF
jgi:hypothetical protein